MELLTKFLVPASASEIQMSLSYDRNYLRGYADGQRDGSHGLSRLPNKRFPGYQAGYLDGFEALVKIRLREAELRETKRGTR